MSGINAASSVGNSANSLQSMLQGRGGVTDSRTIHFGANESKEDRMRRIEEITKGNPNVKLDPEAFQKLMRGGDVDVTLNLEAPDRRNLYIGAFASLAQLAGGMGGAAYNDALGSAVVNRLGGDAEYVAKHGNNYKMGLFGGASAQNGSIQVADAKPREIINPLVNNENIDVQNQIKKNNEVSAVNPVRQRLAMPKDRNTPMAAGMKAEEYFDFSEDKQNKLKKPSGEENLTVQQSSEELRNIYKDKATDHAVKGSKVDSVFIYDGRRGTDANYLNGDDLKVKGKNGKVEFRKDTAEVIQARKQAVKDYSQLAVTAGLISQSDIDKAGDDPKKLKALFMKVENKLEAFGLGKDKEGFLGGHHMVAMQKAISDRIQYNQGGAVAINAVVNGDMSGLSKDPKVSLAQKKAALEFIDPSNKNLSADKINSKFEELKTRVAGGDYSGLTGALDKIDAAQSKIKSDINSVAGGIYAKHNEVLAKNLNSIDGDTSKSAYKGLVDELKSGSTKGTSFRAQINDLKELIKEKQQGKPAALSSTELTGELKLTIDGKTSTGSVAEQSKKIEAAVGAGASFSKENKTALIGAVSENLAGQLKTAGIKGKDGGEITAAQVQDFITKGGAGFQKDKQDKINADPTLKAIFDSSTSAGATSKITNELKGAVNIATKLQTSSSDPTIQNTTSTNIKKVDDFLSRAGNNTASQLAKAQATTASIKGDLNGQVESLLRQNLPAAEVDALKAKGSLIDSKEALDHLKTTVPAEQLAKLTGNITAFQNLEKRVGVLSNAGAVGTAKTEAGKTAAASDAKTTLAQVETVAKAPTGTTASKVEGKPNGKTPEELAKIQAAAGGGNPPKPEAPATEKPKDDLLERFLDIGTKAAEPEKPQEKGKIQEAIDELLKVTSNISKTYFQITDEILSRLNKEAAGSFEYGFGHGNEGRVTANIGGAADRDKDAQGNTIETSKAFQAGNEVGDRTKAAFDTLTRYNKNREDEAKSGLISVGEGLNRYNKNIDRYIDANPQETKKADAYRVTSTPEAKAEAAKYTATGGTSLTDGFIKFAKAVGATKGSGLEQENNKAKEAAETHA